MKKGILQFIIWFFIFTSLSILGTDFRVLQILILLLFLVFGIGFFFLKEYKKYIPICLAFFCALCAGIFAYPIFLGWQ